MSPHRVSHRLLCVVALLALPSSTIAQATALANTVSIDDALKVQDQKPSLTLAPPSSDGAKSIPVTSPGVATPPPVHILYVHGINEVGPDDSLGFRKTLCKVYKACSPPGQLPETIYAEGPFSLGTYYPTLTYLGHPVWANPTEWHASTPYIHRFRLARDRRAPIILDEINWYPLVYPLKCKFLIPGDAKLTGNTNSLNKTCLATAKPDGEHFITYPWPPDPTLFATDLKTQSATFINHSLKLNVMDWGFGDAVMSLGPMSEILTAAIRQLLLQSMKGISEGPAPENIPVFFVTHSLGSYLSLAAMHSAWLGDSNLPLPEFRITLAQSEASDYFACNTIGFYFLANQIGLLELARLGQPSNKPASEVTPAVAALTHYANTRQACIDQHSNSSVQARQPQIISWSAADDLLSWYVPDIPKLAVINLPARNPGFRLPGLVASPTSVHDNYAKNRAVVRVIMEGK